MSMSNLSDRFGFHRCFAQGESLVAMTGMAFIAIVTLVVGGVVWVSARTVDHSVAAQAEQRVGQTSTFIASQSEQRLSDRDLPGLRRLLLDSVASKSIAYGRVHIPGSGVLASSETGEISLNEIPEQLPAGSQTPASTVFDQAKQMAVITEPLQVDGFGGYVLELGIDQSGRIAGADMIRASSVGIVAVGLVLMLVVYRRFRFRLGALAAIGESLRSVQEGERRTDCLLVGESLGVEAVAWNTLLSERDQLEQSRSEFEIVNASVGGGADSFGLPAACNALTQGVLLVDSDMSVLYANGAAAVFLRGMRDQLIGSDLSTLKEFDDLVGGVRDALAQEGSPRRIVEVGDIENLETSGSVLKMSISRVDDDGLTRVVVFIEDITQLRLSSQSQNAFIAQATHELRTPLTTIRLYCEEAIEADEGNEQVREKALNVISSETRRLERIVGDMLCVSEIEAGSLTIRRDSLRTEQLLQELAHDYEAQAKEKAIELSFELPPKFPTILADRDRLGQALHNLIGNAIKYTPSGGKVTVTASFGENDAMTVSVTDSGIGIDESQQERIFERFTRADDRRIAQVTGSGLGLALAQQIARLHDGDITLESAIDQGSTFTLFIPGVSESKQAA